MGEWMDEWMAQKGFFNNFFMEIGWIIFPGLAIVSPVFYVKLLVI